MRTRVNHLLFSQVTQQLDDQYLSRLDCLLENHPVHQRSPYNDLKKLPKKSTRNHLNDLLVHLTWLESLGDISPYLEKINPSKIQHWAAEAKISRCVRNQKNHSTQTSHFITLLNLHQWGLIPETIW